MNDCLVFVYQQEACDLNNPGAPLLKFYIKSSYAPNMTATLTDWRIHVFALAAHKILLNVSFSWSFIKKLIRWVDNTHSRDLEEYEFPIYVDKCKIMSAHPGNISH